MISIQREGALLVVGVFGEITLADYRRFEQEVVEQLQKAGQVNVLLDLRDMLGYTLDVVLEDIKFLRNHSQDVGRVAMLTNTRWAPWSAWLSQLFVNAEIRVFDEEGLARAWLAGTEV
jgi:hypothetical protein